MRVLDRFVGHQEHVVDGLLCDGEHELAHSAWRQRIGSDSDQLEGQPAQFTDTMGNMEARVGIEPTYKGFADLSLTTWVPRLIR